jgi:adenylate kinase family enzyme
MKVAVFGKPGGGKSTLAREIAARTGLPLHPLDLIQFDKGGTRFPDEVFIERHAAILTQESWVIDGFGIPRTFEDLLRAANVLVYVERPAVMHYWWVTKRLLMSPLRPPIGWPEGSPLLKSTMDSYRYLRLSGRFWTSAFRAKLLALRPEKQVYIIRRSSDEKTMLSAL